MQEPLMTPEELAARWGLTTLTLDRWRWTGRGPRFFKPGRKVKYRVQDIETYEEQRARQSTTHTQEEILLREFQQAKMNKQRRFK
jgi:predicted site-specific integrase-resolvase